MIQVFKGDWTNESAKAFNQPSPPISNFFMILVLAYAWIQHTPKQAFLPSICPDGGMKKLAKRLYIPQVFVPFLENI